MNPVKDKLLMSRREALVRVSAALGGVSLVGGSALLTACAGPRPTAADLGHTPFSATDVAFLDEVAETILPETATPGAKAAGVGPFMALMVTDCYDPAEQAIFRAGFMGAQPEQRLALLEGFDREQKGYTDSKAKEAPAHWFRMVKELTLLGYFTSEIGCTKAMRYVEAPGRYEPCLPLQPGETAWASHA